MKYIVNDTCVGCGLCAATCPEVFEMTDAGTAKAMAGEVPMEYEAAATQACADCLVSAIEETE